MRDNPIPGELIRITTASFPRCAPQGSQATVLRVGEANWPPVPYFFVASAAGNGEIGLYRHEFEIRGREGRTGAQLAGGTVGGPQGTVLSERPSPLTSESRR